MRALTVQQPWAWAIVHAGKTVENRTRNIAGDYRGPVAIHAGRTLSRAGMESPLIHAAMRQAPRGTSFEEGAVIGVAQLVDVHHDHDETCADHAHGPTDAGWYLACSPWAEPDVWHLVLANPRPLRVPISTRGHLGLWAPDTALARTIAQETR